MAGCDVRRGCLGLMTRHYGGPEVQNTTTKHHTQRQITKRLEKNIHKKKSIGFLLKHSVLPEKVGPVAPSPDQVPKKTDHA